MACLGARGRSGGTSPGGARGELSPAPAARSALSRDLNAPCRKGARSDRRHIALVHERRQRLRERLRAEWIAGAEEERRRRTGRPMTTAELNRVLRPYPGDV